MRVCPRHHSLNGKGSPRWQRTLHHRRLQKLALNSGTTGGARKKASIPPKKLLPRPPPFHRRHNRQEPRPVSVASWNVHHICDELKLRHFHPHDHRDVHNVVELHHGHWSLHTTGVSTTLSRASTGCNCGISAVFSTCAPENLLDLHSQHRSPCHCTATVEFLWIPEQDHGNLPLHHDRDVDDLVQKSRRAATAESPQFFCTSKPKCTCHCTPTGMSTTLSENCTCRCNNGHVTTLSKNCKCGTPSCTVWTKTLVLHNNGQDNLVQELDEPTSTTCTTGTSTTTSKKAHAARNAASPAPPPPPHHDHHALPSPEHA